MRILAFIAVVIAALALSAPIGATTNPQAAVEIACLKEKQKIVVTFNYTGFSPQWNLTAMQSITVTGGGTFEYEEEFHFQGPSGQSEMVVPLPSFRLISVHAMTVVRAAGGRVKAEGHAEIHCSNPPPPPPPPPVVVNPSARFWGPCGDPFYRAVLNNRRSDRAVTFRVSYKPFGEPRRTISRRVPAHRLVWTGLFDVAGSTRMTIHALTLPPRSRVLLRSQISAPNRVYKPCPTGVPIIH